MKRKKILFLILLSCFSTFGLAQNITGNLEGWIVDSIDTPLFGVNISLQSENMQGLRGTSTDDEGYFRIFALPIGSYKVKISFVGYREIVFENVQISLGKTTNLGQIQLQPQTYNLPDVIVSGEKFIIDPMTTTYGGNLNAREFENLPVDRNYRSMISLMPLANTSYYGDEVNIGGATGFENKYFIDGVEVTDPLLGNTGTNLPYNFIKEIEVKAGGYEAEFRSSLGGLINVVTYSGTNEFHGSAFGFYTNNRFGSKRYIGSLDPTQGDFSDYDVGISLGGPIILDELWFFAAYNPTFNKRDAEVPSFGIYSDKTLIHSFASKLTWNTTRQLKLILTVTGDPTEREAIGYGVTFPITALLNPDPWLQELRQGGVNVSLNGIYSIGQNILLSSSFSRVMRYDSAEPSTKRGGDEVLYWDYPANMWGGGTWRKWDVYRYSNVAKLSGTIMLGTNILNAGIEYKLDGVNNQDYNVMVIKWDSTNYEERVGIGGKIYQRSPSVFLQDTWQIFRNLSIHGGIRWEDQLVVGSNGQRMQRIEIPLQPRFGFAFLLNEAGSQKIFGSYGRYTQELSLLTPTYWYAEGGSWYRIGYDHDPRISRAGADTIEGGPHSINLEVEGLRDQYFDEFSLGYQQAIGDNFLVSAQGVYRTLREAIAGVYNPGRGLMVEWGNTTRPKRNYSALVFTIETQKVQQFNFLASYVLSRDYGNYEGVFNALNHTIEPNMNFLSKNLLQVQRAYGLLPNDRTHVFKFSGSYNISHGLTTGISFVVQTGTPLSEYANGGNYRILLIPRGTAGRTPTIWDLNARFIYELSYLNNWNTRLILDVFHVASQRRPVDVDQHHYLINSDGNFIPSPAYGEAYRYQPAMSVRLGMEVNF